MAKDVESRVKVLVDVLAGKIETKKVKKDLQVLQQSLTGKGKQQLFFPDSAVKQRPKLLESNINKMGNSLNGFTNLIEKSGKAANTQKNIIGSAFQDMSQQVGRKLPGALVTAGKHVNNFQKQVAGSMQKSRVSILSFRRAMGALSILFAAQSIIRNVTRLSSVTVAKFMEITKAQTQAGQAMTSLSANVDSLKFTIGNAIAVALEPMIPTLIKITEKVSDFVQQHPKLTAFGIGFLFVTGVLALAFAQVILLASGIANLLFGGAAGGLVGAGAAAGTLATKLGKLVKFGSTVLGISLIIEGVSDFVTGTEDAMGSYLDVLKGAGVFLAKGKVGGTALASVIAMDLVYDVLSGRASTAGDVLNNALVGAIAGAQIGGPWGAGIGFVVAGTFTWFNTQDFLDTATSISDKIHDMFSFGLGTKEGPEVSVGKIIGEGLAAAESEFASTQFSKQIIGPDQIQGVKDITDQLDLFKTVIPLVADNINGDEGLNSSLIGINETTAELVTNAAALNETLLDNIATDAAIENSQARQKQWDVEAASLAELNKQAAGNVGTTQTQITNFANQFGVSLPGEDTSDRTGTNSN